MSSYEERKQARIDRYKDLAAKKKRESEEAYKASKSMVEHIPMGQPILVGHHSEKGHRNLLDRSWNKMGQSVKLGETSDYYADKAKAAESNTAISSDDPDALTKLRDKLTDLEETQEKMKAANKVVKSKKLSEVEKVDGLKAQGYTEKEVLKILEPDFGGRVGFPSYLLTNNNGNMRRIKQRITEFENKEGDETTERTVHGVNIVDSIEDNRLQLFFPGKPEFDVRKDLKRNGYRWSPSNGCWQKYRSKWAVQEAIELVEKLCS